MVDGELQPEEIDRLVDAAARARANAYAPYSRFAVGAALLAADGRVFEGCNVENGSFGLTICAEQAAVCHAVGAGCREFRAIAVAADTADAPVTPCGACRQVLGEFNPRLTVICAAPSGDRRILGLDDLLPGRFEFEAGNTRQ